MVVKNKIPKEWLMKFFEKSGDNELFLENLTATEFGFASFRVNEGELVLLQVYGDGKLWDQFFMELAKNLNLKKIKFATKRNYKGFERNLGYKLAGFILEKEVDYGRNS